MKPEYEKVVENIINEIRRNGIGTRLEMYDASNDKEIVIRYELDDGTKNDPSAVSPYYSPAVRLGDKEQFDKYYGTQYKVWEAMENNGMERTDGTCNRIALIHKFESKEHDGLTAYLVQTKDKDKFIVFHVPK